MKDKDAGGGGGTRAGRSTGTGPGPGPGAGTVWDKRFAGREAVPLLERFNASIREDAFLAMPEIRASTAYAQGLERAGVLTKEETTIVLGGLEKVAARIEGGEDLGRFEDIHSAVELMLTEEVGDVGRKLHTGRSRNEQVVTDERLYLKDKLPGVCAGIEGVQRGLLGLAERWPDAVMPGYTHLQRGQCMLFSHYIMASFWALERGKERLKDALKRIDICPLGSGALAGSTAALDRAYLKELLGFGGMSENSLDAVGDRSFILETLFALGLVVLDLSRLAEDLVIFSTAEFGFLDLDASIATSSSLMPQKRNPDFFELVRAAPARLFGHASRLFMVLKGLPLSYNKDLQDDKEPLRKGIEETADVLAVMEAALARVRPKPGRMRDAIDPGLFATDMADYLVEKGIPFREAHGLVAAIVSFAELSGRDPGSLTIEVYRSFHAAFGEDVKEVFDPARSIWRKKTYGSTNPDMVKRQLEKAKSLI